MHATAVRRARRRRSPARRDRVARSARHDGVRSEYRRAEPRRRDHDRGRVDVHRRDDRPAVPRLRDAHGTRAVVDDAAGGREGDADDVPDGVGAAARGDQCGRGQRRGVRGERCDRGVRVAGGAMSEIARSSALHGGISVFAPSLRARW